MGKYIFVTPRLTTFRFSLGVVLRMSLDSLLQETWLLMRPQWAGQQPAASNSLLDFALSGADNIMSLPAAFGANPMHWDGPIPAEPPRAVAAEPPARAAAQEVVSPLVVKLPQKSSRATPCAEDVRDRIRSLDTWCNICDKMGAAFTVVTLMGGTLDREKADEIFAENSPGTFLQEHLPGTSSFGTATISVPTRPWSTKLARTPTSRTLKRKESRPHVQIPSLRHVTSRLAVAALPKVSPSGPARGAGVPLPCR